MIFRPFIFALFLIGLGLMTACGEAPSPPEEGLREIELDLTDSLQQRIQSFRYYRQADSLLPFLSSESATHRYLAARAYGALLEAVPLDSLKVLLGDPVDEVRAAAAFALGQSGEPETESYLLEAFDRYDTLGRYRLANRAILEAVGKVGGMASLRALSAISTYGPQDTALLEGQAWGLYRYALRGMHVPEGTALMIDRVVSNSIPDRVRLIAANYLYRSQGIAIDEEHLPALARTAIGSEDPRIRMALAIGLAKTRSPLALQTLDNLFRLDADYRVQCNVLSALPNFDYQDVRSLALEALTHESLKVAERAAQFFLDHGQARDGFILYSRARRGLPWQVHIPLYAAVLRHLPTQYSDVRNAANGRLLRKFREPASPFEQIAALQAMAENPWNYRNIYELGFDHEHGLVRQGAVEALGRISNNPSYATTFTRLLAPRFREAIESGDPAMIEPAAEALMARPAAYAEQYDDLDFLEAAYGQIELRQAFATKQLLAQALDSLQGGDRARRLASPLRPLDWDLLEAAGERPRIELATDSGDIVLELFTLDAPGTVASMLDRCRSGQYEGGYFYRVVPNFVAQGVQPLAFQPAGFTLTSEVTARNYLEAGLLGMASRGPHTESTQFFITYSPTPHLDGRYTLFGRVVSGMEVVHQLGRGSVVEGCRLLSTD